MPRRRLRLRIRGKVQRVGFRWFVRGTARRCELAGWVKNNPDGTVELCVEGEEDCVARLRSAVAMGPEGARVDAVETLEERVHVGEGGAGAGAGEDTLPYPFQMVR